MSSINGYFISKYLQKKQKMLYFYKKNGGCMEISYKPLFKLLIDKNLKKSDLKDLIGISLTTLAKLSKGEPIQGKPLKSSANTLTASRGILWST
jgi:DNA-binding Xre family transcriptional regulator